MGSKISENRFWTIAEFLIKTILAFVLLIIIAKSLGAVSLGVFAYWLTLAGLLTGLSKLGLDAIILREVPIMPNPSSIIMPALKISLTAGILLYIISASIHYFTLDNTEYWEYLILTISIIFSSYNVFDSYYKAVEKSQINFYVKVPLYLIFFATKIYCLSKFHSLLFLAILTLFEHLSIFCVYFAITDLKRKYTTQNEIKEFLTLNKKAIVKITLSSSLALLYLRTDTIFIKYFLGDVQLGVYTAGSRIVEFTFSALAIYTVALAPSLVRHIGSEEKTSLVIKKFMLQAFSFWISGVVLIYFFGEYLILSVFGLEFSESYDILWTYYLFVLLAAFGSIMQRIYLAKKDDSFVFFKSALAFILNVLGNLFLIQTLGLIGAVYSTGIAMFVTNFVLPLLYTRYRRLLYQSLISTYKYE